MYPLEVKDWGLLSLFCFLHSVTYLNYKGVV